MAVVARSAVVRSVERYYWCAFAIHVVNTGALLTVRVGGAPIRNAETYLHMTIKIRFRFTPLRLTQTA